MGHPLHTEVAVAIYRCVAEGITNAFRHGGARRVAVCVEISPDERITVDVRDDGAGGRITPGIGLTSLQHRAEQLGGSLAVEPSDGAGIRLHMELPMNGAT